LLFIVTNITNHLQVNEVIQVNWEKNCFHRIVRLCICVHAANRSIGQLGRFKTLIASAFKTVKGYGLQVWRTCFQGQSGHDP